MESLLFAITVGGFTIFYGTDTSGLSEETWQAFHQHQYRFDLVILDHTYGPGQEAGDHLNAAHFIEHVNRMREEDLLADRARLLATHIAHEGNMVHPELAAYATGHGYEIAYDGLSIQLPNK